MSNLAARQGPGGRSAVAGAGGTAQLAAEMNGAGKALDQRSGSGPVLASSCLAMLAVGANSTAIMAALPAMRSELALSPGGVQWAVNAYLVASAAFIVLGGQAADRFGARAASLAGLVLFAVASCVIATAGSEAVLLAGRALQGLAAAFAVPCTLAAVHAAAAPERRAGAIGAWTGFLMLGFSIGPLLGGALTHLTGWRAIFWLNVLLMLVAGLGLALAGRRRPRAHRPGGRTGPASSCWRGSWWRSCSGCMRCRRSGPPRPPRPVRSPWRRSRSRSCCGWRHDPRHRCSTSASSRGATSSWGSPSAPWQCSAS